MEDKKKQSGIKRRDFLKMGLAGLTVAVAAPRLSGAKSSSGGHGSDESSPHRWGMVIDQAKCVGCGHCTMACRANNDVPPNMEWNRLVEAGEVNGKTRYLPVPCMQCGDAPCANICMVGATYQRPDGIVMMDYDKCIGCRYCEIACPYGARAFNWEEFDDPNPAVPRWGQPEVARRPRGVVEKCSFCYQRIDRGLSMGLTPGVDQAATPACVVACPMGARVFGDLNDPDSPVSKLLANHASFRLREGLGTDPAVYYLPVHDEDAAEEEEVS